MPSPDTVSYTHLGYAFTILTLKDYSRRYHLTADETSGEPLNDATYERNNKIYDRLGVEITTHEDDSTAAALQNACLLYTSRCV